MIEKLKSCEKKQAAIIYNRGLQMQIPKSSSTMKNTLNKLERLEGFVYKNKNNIEGLLTFNIINNNIELDFICVMNPGKGVGKKLMISLTKFATKNNLDKIFSSISSQDKRAKKFYKKFGFRKYKTKKVDKEFSLILVKINPNKVLKIINDY